jgi:photosystem II stability/assembly factor-like uncharacterized protein
MSRLRHSRRGSWGKRHSWLAALAILSMVLCQPSPSLRSMSAAAQAVPVSWQSLGGPAGRVSLLTALPGSRDLYAVSVTGVNRRDDQTQWQDAGTFVRSDALYRSQNGGTIWQPATNNLIPGAITALYADPKTGAVYLGVQGSGEASMQRRGLWRSSDQGAHWEQVLFGQENLDIWRVTRNAIGGYLFVAATEGIEQPQNHLYRSGDDGRSWTSLDVSLVSTSGPGGVLTDVIPHPSAPDRLFLTTHSGEIYASNDAGETWASLLTAADGAPVGFIPVQLAISPDSPDTMLAALTVRHDEGDQSGDNLVIQRSTDGGKTWHQPPGSGLPAQARAETLAALQGNVFLLSIESGTYRSADGGITWRLLEGPLSSGSAAAFVPLPDAPTTVLAATGYGVFISQDAGALWQPHGSGLPFSSRIAGLLTDARQPELIFVILDSLGAVTNQPPTQLMALPPSPPVVLRSTDGGTIWTAAAQGLPDLRPTAWSLDPNDPSTIFVSGSEYFCRSSDAGVSWQVARLPSSGYEALAVAASDSNILYLGGTSLLRSTDHGTTWQTLETPADQAGAIRALTVDPGDSEHVWAGLDAGVVESTDGGKSWHGFGLRDHRVRWLVADGASGASGPATIYAGVFEDGIYRWDAESSTWTSVSSGLPASTTILSFIPDPRSPGTLWASRDGGGMYRSTDRGTSWTNVAAGIGDNLTLALAIDHAGSGEAETSASGVLMGTATAGVWALRSGTAPTQSPTAVDARIEIVWPHDWAPVNKAGLANIGMRLFSPNSLLQPACGWTPEVTVWQAVDSAPVEPLAKAEQRTVDNHPFPYWTLNDVDVSYANDPTHKLYFMVRTAEAETSTAIWAHAVDPRTYLPFPDVPSGIAGDIQAVDARIQIVWPHDENGAERTVTEGAYANIVVALFKHGTRLSVPLGWQPPGLTLYGAWNQEIGRPLATTAIVQERKSGAISYPVWEFTNIPVARAANPVNKVYFWVRVNGIETYPTIWAHGADARTFFPATDEPAQGCIP